MIENKIKLYVCRRIRLLNFLLNEGFKIEKTGIDKYNPRYNIWYFIDTPELRDKIEEYYENYNRERSEN